MIKYGGKIFDDNGSGGIVYNGFIEFKEETPQDVIKRIKDIDSSNTVYISQALLAHIWDTKD